MTKFALPFIAFVVLLIFLVVSLKEDPRYVPSPLIDKPAPNFVLPKLFNPEVTFTPKEFVGRVWMLNAWSSDCVACRQEHPILVALSKKQLLPMVGLNYRDKDQFAKQVLTQSHNPYSIVVSDHRGRVGIDYGVYAVPETFIIDKKGIIRFKQIGPITPQLLRDTVLPLIQKLKQEPA